MMTKKYKPCGACGGDSFRIQLPSKSLICVGCGANVGWYHDGEVPPSSVLNEPELKAAYMDVFQRQPTRQELRIIEREVGNDFSRIAEDIQSAVERLKRKGELT